MLKTQLYSAPNDVELRESFLTRYIRACMPVIPALYGAGGKGKCREDTIFAITVKEGAKVKVGDGREVRLQSRIKDVEGYIGTSSPS